MMMPGACDEQFVLGIDAAWTEGNPSGLALVGYGEGRTRLITLAGSYGEFLGLSGIDGSEVQDIPRACATIAVRQPDLVAIDMPMSLDPIVTRRASDSAISRLWGGRKCSTHTPSALRPGAVGVRLHDAFSSAGYGLATTSIFTPSLIEVYPHPALVELTGAAERLPYKAQKTGAYWKGMPIAARRLKLFAVWAEIVVALDRQIDGVAKALPVPTEGAAGASLKPFEDKLDAVVCAWVGVLALRGKATPYGDDRSAIWLPTPGV